MPTAQKIASTAATAAGFFFKYSTWGDRMNSFRDGSAWSYAARSFGWSVAASFRIAPLAASWCVRVDNA
jgi:hypothetical protein